MREHVLHRPSFACRRLVPVIAPQRPEVELEPRRLRLHQVVRIDVGELAVIGHVLTLPPRVPQSHSGEREPRRHDLAPEGRELGHEAQLDPGLHMAVEKIAHRPDRERLDRMERDPLTFGLRPLLEGGAVELVHIQLDLAHAVEPRELGRMHARCGRVEPVLQQGALRVVVGPDRAAGAITREPVHRGVSRIDGPHRGFVGRVRPRHVRLEHGDRGVLAEVVERHHSRERANMRLMPRIQRSVSPALRVMNSCIAG